MTAALIIQYVLAALQLLPASIAAVSTASADVAQLAADLKAMQAENRDPSQAEWAALNARMAVALDALQNAKPPV